MTVRSRDPQLEKDVVKAFAFISAATKPQVTRSNYDAQRFGDAVVELETDKLRVHVVRDRRQILVDLGPVHHHAWFDEDIVLAAAGLESENTSFEELSRRTVDDAATRIAANLVTILKMFEPENWGATEIDLNARRKRRGRNFVARTFADYEVDPEREIRKAIERLFKTERREGTPDDD